MSETLMNSWSFHHSTHRPITDKIDKVYQRRIIVRMAFAHRVRDGTGRNPSAIGKRTPGGSRKLAFLPQP
jgi:hypothetical protein